MRTRLLKLSTVTNRVRNRGRTARRSVAKWPHANRVVLLSILACLIVVEVQLLEGFLPYKWRHAIHQQSERVIPSEEYNSHPDMDWEFELDFRQHPTHRVEMFAIVGVLAAAVAYLIVKHWRELCISKTGFVELRITVRPSPKHDHEVCLEAGGESLIDRFSGGLVGLDPDDLLTDPCPLRAEDFVHRVVIGRCSSCGEVGCDSVEIEIRRDHDEIIWMGGDSLQQVRFRAIQYDREVARALRDIRGKRQNARLRGLLNKPSIESHWDREALNCPGLQADVGMG